MRAAGFAVGTYTAPSSALTDLVAVTGTSTPCSLGFSASKGTTYYFAVDGKTAGPFTLSVKLAPLNDDIANAITVTPGTPVAATTTGATKEAGEPDARRHRRRVGLVPLRRPAQRSRHAHHLRLELRHAARALLRRARLAEPARRRR